MADKLDSIRVPVHRARKLSSGAQHHRPPRDDIPQYSDEHVRERLPLQGVWFNPAYVNVMRRGHDAVRARERLLLDPREILY